MVWYVMIAEICVAVLVCIPVTLLGIELLPDAPLTGAWLGWVGYMIAWMLAMSLAWRAGRWRKIEL